MGCILSFTIFPNISLKPDTIIRKKNKTPTSATPQVSGTGRRAVIRIILKLGIAVGDINSLLARYPPTTNRPIKKHCKRVPVPVSEDSDTDDNYHSQPQWDAKFTALSREERNDLIDYFLCPICQDIMVEPTAASCGHSFCSSCLETWTNMKPTCPVCSKNVSYRHRLYNEDLLIERMLNLNGRRQRQPQERDRTSSIRDLLTDLSTRTNNNVAMMTLRRCKMFWSFIKNSIRTFPQAIRRRWRNLQAVEVFLFVTILVFCIAWSLLGRMMISNCIHDLTKPEEINTISYWIEQFTPEIFKKPEKITEPEGSLMLWSLIRESFIASYPVHCDDCSKQRCRNRDYCRNWLDFILILFVFYSPLVILIFHVLNYL